MNIKHKLYKTVSLGCALLMGTALLTGCSSDKKETASQSYRVTDKRGMQLEFKEKPQRIVSLMPSSDEIIFGLVEHSRILALSRWSRNPHFSNIVEEAKSMPLVASDTPEFLLKHKADVVITREDMGNNPALLKTLGDMGIPVYVFEGPQSIKAIKELIRNLGKVVGETAGAEKMVKEMDKRFLEIRRQQGEIPLEQQKTAVFWTSRGIIGGNGTLVNDILKQAQIKDGLEKHPSRTAVSKEFVVSANPDYIIILGYDYNGKQPQRAMKEILSDPALSTVKAVKEKNIVVMPLKYTSCNSQYVVEAVAKLAKTVYGK